MKSAFALAAAAALSLAAAPLDAALMKATASGKMVTGYDNIGVFGLGTSLVGYDASITYYFDVDDAVIDSGYFYGTTIPYTYASFGQWFGTPASGSITIGGVTRSLTSEALPGGPASGGMDQIEYYKSPYGEGYGDLEIRSYDGEAIGYEDHNDRFMLEASIGASGAAIGGGLFDPVSVAGTGGGFLFEKEVGVMEESSFTGGRFDNSGGFLLSLVGAVPEPSTWAMMVLGFGLVGAAIRRGRARGDFRAVGRRSGASAV